MSNALIMVPHPTWGQHNVVAVHTIQQGFALRVDGQNVEGHLVPVAPSGSEVKVEVLL